MTTKALPLEFAQRIDPRTRFLTLENQTNYYNQNPGEMGRLVGLLQGNLNTLEGKQFQRAVTPRMCMRTAQHNACYKTCLLVHQLPVLEALKRTKFTQSVDPRTAHRKVEKIDSDTVRGIQKLIENIGIDFLAKRYKPLMCDRSQECTQQCPYIHNDATLTAFLHAVQEAKQLKNLTSHSA